MNLKEWRMSKGYSLKKVAEVCNKRSASTIFNWERYGVKSLRVADKLKALSDGKITEFGGVDG